MSATILEAPAIRRLAYNSFASMKAWDLGNEMRQATGETYLNLLRLLPWNAETLKSFYTRDHLSLAEFEELLEFLERAQQHPAKLSGTYRTSRGVIGRWWGDGQARNLLSSATF